MLIFLLEQEQFITVLLLEEIHTYLEVQLQFQLIQEEET